MKFPRLFPAILLAGCAMGGADGESDAGARLLVFDAAPPRFVLPRMSDQVRHAPCATSEDVACTVDLTRDRAGFDRLEAATRSLPRRAPSLTGVAELAWAGSDPLAAHRAVTALTSRRDVDSNDLAAAYLVRGILDDDPVDFVRALDLLEARSGDEGTRPEMLFNRALVLERLGLHARARAAWSSFLTRFPRDPWVGEARTRLEGLEGSGLDAPEPRELLVDAMRAGKRDDFVRVASLHPDHARDLAFDVWLPILAEDPGAEPVRTLLDAAAAAVGDPTIAGILDGFAGPDGDEVRSAVAAFARARALRVSGDLEGAVAAFERAASAPPPVAAWAVAELGTTQYLRFHFDEALRAFHTGLSQAAVDRYPALRGRLLWGRGVTHAREGRLEAAWTDLLAASRLFASVGERWNQTYVESMVGEMLGQMGRPMDAWPFQLSAVFDLASFPPSDRQHSALATAAAAAFQGGWTHAAIAFQEEGLRVARQVGEPWSIAEAEAQLIRFRDRRGDPISAADLDVALAQARRVPDDAGRRLALSIAQASAARVLEGPDPLRAAALHDSVVAFQASQGHVIAEADALLARARFRRDRGRPDEALADLETAFQVVERQWFDIRGSSRAATFGEASQRIVDDAVALAVTVERSPVRALHFLERARRLAFPPGSPGMPPPWPADAEAPPGHLFVQFAVVDGRIHRWTVLGDSLDFVTVDAPADSVSTAVEAWVEGLRRGDEAMGAARGLGSVLLPRAFWEGRAHAVLVVPDRALNAVPFGALAGPDGRRAIEFASVTIVPSFGAALARSRTRGGGPPPESALVAGTGTAGFAGDPSLEALPGVEEEIETVAAAWPHATVLGPDQANRGTILDGLDRHEVFHFAGHAFVDPDHPDASHLVVHGEHSDDPDRLYARDLDGPPFRRLRTVVLSSCSSVGGARLRVGGLWGLGRPLLARGARSVIGSLWPIDDRTAASVVPRIHEALAAGASPEEALRAAQLEAYRNASASGMADGTWAAFQHLGR